MRAWLGEITPDIRAITVDLSGRQVTVRIFHEGAASAEFIEASRVADTEILADFPSSGPEAIALNTLLVRCDEPARLPVLGLPIFVRKGTHFQP